MVEELGPARLVVTGRAGGLSAPPWDTLNLADHVGDDPRAVAGNRGRVAAAIGGPELAVVRAEHGNRVRYVTEPGTAEAGDVLVTDRTGLGLLVLAADCVPLVVVAPDVRALAVVHAGWRGVAADAVGEAVEFLRGMGAQVPRLLVRIGPSICPRCYEVSKQVQREVAAAAPPAVAETSHGTPAVDLCAGVRWQLQRRGVDRIVVDGRCTFQTPGLYSHRRDGVTGRHGIAAVLEER